MRFLIIALLVAGCEKAGESRDPIREPVETEARRDRADVLKLVAELELEIVKLEREASHLVVQVQGAIDSVVAAQTEADRASAKAKLAGVQKDHAEYLRRIAIAKEGVQRAKRLEAPTISKACLLNPLADGCI